MKKGIFSISEKHERITIRYKRKQTSSFAICNECKKQSEWMTVDEVASLSGMKINEIKENLQVLRNGNKLIN